MRAVYGSRARSLWIEFDPAGQQSAWTDTEDVGAGCAVALGLDDRPFAVGLLDPTAELTELAAAARIHELDLDALRAAARAALAAPDRAVSVELEQRATV